MFEWWVLHQVFLLEWDYKLGTPLPAICHVLWTLKTLCGLWAKEHVSIPKLLHGPVKLVQDSKQSGLPATRGWLTLNTLKTLKDFIAPLIHLQKIPIHDFSQSVTLRATSHIEPRPCLTPMRTSLSWFAWSVGMSPVWPGLLSVISTALHQTFNYLRLDFHQNKSSLFASHKCSWKIKNQSKANKKYKKKFPTIIIFGFLRQASFWTARPPTLRVRPASSPT